MTCNPLAVEADYLSRSDQCFPSACWSDLVNESTHSFGRRDFYDPL